MPTDAASRDEPGHTFLYAGIVAGVVTAGGVAVWIGAGLEADAIYRDLEPACGGSCQSDEALAEIDHGETLDAVATAGLVVSAIGAASTIVLFSLHAAGGIESAISPRPGGAVVALGGRF